MDVSAVPSAHERFEISPSTKTPASLRARGPAHVARHPDAFQPPQFDKQAKRARMADKHVGTASLLTQPRGSIRHGRGVCAAATP